VGIKESVSALSFLCCPYGDNFKRHALSDDEWRGILKQVQDDAEKAKERGKAICFDNQIKGIAKY